MAKLLVGRRNLFGASLVSLVVLTAVVVTALRTEGYRANHVDLNDASVWISGDAVPELKDSPPSLGRVNTEVHEINATIGSSPGTALYQSGDTVFFKSGATLRSIDAGTETTHKSVLAGPHAAVAIGGKHAAELTDNGAIWVVPMTQFSALPKDSEPLAKVESKSLLVMGADGVAYTFRPGSDHGFAVTALGAKTKWSLDTTVGSVGKTALDPDAATATGTVQLSVVGSTPVVLDTAKRAVFVPGQDPVHLAASDGPGEALALQQPGPAAPSAVVATGRGLVSVSLTEPSQSLLQPAPSGDVDAFPERATAPARPAMVAGCTIGAWGASTQWLVRVCAGGANGFSKSYLTQKTGSAPSGPLVIRTNHDRFVINDTSNGEGYVLTDDGVKQVTGWRSAHTKSEKPDTEKKGDIRNPDPKRDCTKDEGKTLTAPDVPIGAREGIPVRLSLGQIDGLQSPQCQVLSLVNAKATTPETTAQIVGARDALQITATKAGTTAKVEYTIDAGTSTEHATGTISVTVHPNNSMDNRAPKTHSGPRQPTMAVAGQTVSYNALDATTDPEGDAVVLTDACVGDAGCLKTPSDKRSTDDGTVQSQPDGWIRFTPPEAAKGKKKLSFKVVDQWGAEAFGWVTVKLTGAASAAPVTHDDHGRIVHGQTGTVDLVGNDVDPAGRTLTVQSAVPVRSTALAEAKATIRPGTDGTLEVGANAPLGTTLVKYVVGDGVLTAEGYARIDVVKPGGNPIPVAVRDDAVTRHKHQVLVDVTANDFDAADNVLVVQSVTVDRGKAQLMADGHTVQVTPPDGFDDPGGGPMTATYTVSNGAASAQGTLVVSPYPVTTDQPPFTQPDTGITVKAGGVVSIPVLANDADPEGAPLSLVSVQGLASGRGSAFVGGDEVRFVAPTGADAAGTSQFSYTASDTPLGVEGQRSSNQVIVQVLPASAQNRAPQSLALTARAVQGRTTHIAVPMLTADPDGDVVAIVGESKAPARGTVKETGDGFDYTPGSSDADLGTFTMTFQLTDGRLYSESTVRIGVVPPVESTGPVATPIKVVVKPGQAKLINLVDPHFVTSTAGGLAVQTSGNGKPTPSSDLGSFGKVSPKFLVRYTAPDSIGGSSETASTSLSYVVQDTSGQSTPNVVVVTIDPNAPELAPQPKDDFEIPAHKGDKVEFDVLDNDTDPTTGSVADLKFEPIGAPNYVTWSNGKASFTMPDHSVRFRYQVKNSTNDLTAKAVVSVPVNIGVKCRSKTIPLGSKKQATIDVLDRCTGPDGAKLHLKGTTMDSRAGSAVVHNQKVQVTVNKDAVSGSYSLTTNVCVETGCNNTTTTVTDTVRITNISKKHEAEKHNDPPTFDAMEVNVAAGGQQIVGLTERVHDANPGDRANVRFTSVSPKSLDGVHATLTGSTLKIDADAKAKTARVPLTVTLTDGHPGVSVEGKVTVIVEEAQRDPVRAVDDTERVVQAGDGGQTVTFAVLENDLNPAGPSSASKLKVSSVGTPSHKAGTAGRSSDGSKVTFTPKSSFGGTTAFTYVAQDSADPDRHATATVTVHVVGFPGQPGIPQGTGQQAKQVPLQWNPADGNGGTIDHYTVECAKVAGGACPTSTMTAEGTSIVFTNLHNAVAYKFRVRAHNEAGDGRWSAWSASTTPDAVPAPPQMREVGIFEGSGDVKTPDGVGRQLTVTWTQPDYEGSPVNQYTIHVNGARDIPISRGSAAFGAKRYTVTGLVNGTSYPVWVSATNNSGTVPDTGRGEQPLTMSGTPAAPPAAPALSAPTSGDAQLTVNWSAPATNGDAISSYEIVASGSAGTLPTATQSGAATSAVVAPTVNGEIYTVKVRAANKAGWGGYGQSSGMSKGPPDPVTNVAAKPDTSPAGGTIVLSFTQPNERGSAINRYVVSGGGLPARSFAPGHATPGSTVTFPISGLTNGQSYGPITVKACNTSHGGSDPAHECSTDGSSTGTVTPFGAPVVGTASINGGKVTYHWSSNGANNFSVSCSNGAAASNVTSTNATCDYGNGGSRNVSATITAKSQNISKQANATAKTESTYHGSTGYSSTAFNGANTAGGTCTGCVWVDVTLSGFRPNTSYQFYCRTNVSESGGTYSPDGATWADQRTGSSGNRYGGSIRTDGSGGFRLSGGTPVRGSISYSYGSGCHQYPGSGWIAGYEIITPEYTPTGFTYSTSGDARHG